MSAISTMQPSERPSRPVADVFRPRPSSSAHRHRRPVSVFPRHSSSVSRSWAPCVSTEEPQVRTFAAPSRTPAARDVVFVGAAKLTQAPLSDPEPSLRRGRRTGRSLRAPRRRLLAAVPLAASRVTHALVWRVPQAPTGASRRQPKNPLPYRLTAAGHSCPGGGGRSRRIGRCCPFERASGWKLECEL